MEQNYAVTLYGKNVGKVRVSRQGLYYHIVCRCRMDSSIIYRLIVSGDLTRENLGILVPECGDFILRTKIPVKKIGDGNLKFMLVPKQEDISGPFVRIIPEEPFAYISHLKECFLVLRDGQPGVCIGKMQEH